MSSFITAEQLETEWEGKTYEEVLKMISVNAKLPEDIINELTDGNCELWFKTIKFTFKDNVLISKRYQ